VKVKPENMTTETSGRLFPLIRRDLARYALKGGGMSFLRKVFVVLDTPGLQAILVYRFGFWVNRTFRFPLFRFPLKLTHFLLNKLCIVLWGIHINAQAEIGAGLYIGHFGGILVGPSRIGEDCNINHQVTIGGRADGIPGNPTIGRGVWIGAGSIIFGGIHIGDGATICPLTVVSRSLPPKVMVIGNPMRLLRKDYDNSVQRENF